MIYRLVLALRHLAYDKGWKKSRKAAVPTVCLGNITVGGTGKTPHTELVLRTLMENRIGIPAVLSRGYKRKSRGFLLLSAESNARDGGDEPLQIARKFPSIRVAVDKNRLHGCEMLLEGADPKPEVIVLDDAFQYRRLSATLNIVLVDYNRPIFKDRLMPWGRLRDFPSRIREADIVIVTKCPAYLEDSERTLWRENLGLADGQQLFFTTVRYCTPEPVFPEADPHYIYSRRLVLVSGIANDAPLRMYLSDTYKIVRRLEYPDHHRFSQADVHAINAALKENPTACLMTTEKDAQRLRDCKKVPDNIRTRLFYVPIQACFLFPEDERAFVAALEKAVTNL